MYLVKKYILFLLLDCLSLSLQRRGKKTKLLISLYCAIPKKHKTFRYRTWLHFFVW